MLDAAKADLFQYISLPLEIVGITLAAIEIRYPEAAARLARYVKGNASPPLPRTKFLGVMASPWANLGVGTFFFFTLLFTIQLDPLDPRAAGALAIIAIAIPAVIFRAAVTWVDGREVGTLGIVLAAFGAVLEVYQFAVLLFL